MSRSTAEGRRVRWASLGPAFEDVPTKLRDLPGVARANASEEESLARLTVLRRFSFEVVEYSAEARGTLAVGGLSGWEYCDSEIDI